ncbi:ATP-binding cassette sub-family B member 9-like [Mizuhopecten yessoensis]|uniref:ABC-type oligopeptide transporter ABCB9 n=1 Tax=Mizuhopecten yessoensis TaxID=6573 RepID=A0A210R6Z4_MIZYE|nr:ATP-binding cassette sub-family B member 9-like [Mizuhopecten yessoensis]OWF56666.1 ATP-binding cassette sub-family B member 9 [Mizuhopecten yessoensis]
MVRRMPVIIGCALTALCDATVATVLFGRGNQIYDRFSTATAQFSVLDSTFELWCFGVLRACVLFGLTLAVIRHPVEAITRIKKVEEGAICFPLVMGIYDLVKLLLISDDSARLYDKWFWAQFSWCLMGCCLFHIHYYALGKITLVLDGELFQNDYVRINDGESDTEERKPLLSSTTARQKPTSIDDDDDEDSDDESSEDRSVAEKRATIFRLFSYSKPDISYIMGAFFFLVIAAVGEIFIPYYTGQVVDGIVIDKSKAKFTQAIIYVVVISAGSAIASGLRGGLFTIAMARLNVRIRDLLFSSIVDQEIGFFDSVKTGDITSRLTSDTTVMSDTVTLNLNIFLRSTIQAVGVIVFMAKLSWRMSILSLIVLPLVFGVSKVYGKYYKRLSKQVQNRLAKANEVAEETFTSMRTVRSFANESSEKARYYAHLFRMYKVKKKQAMFYAGYVWTNKLFELMLTASVLYYGGHLVISAKLSGGNLVSFVLYQMQLGECLDSIGNVYTGLMQAAGASQKVFEYMDRTPNILNNGTVAPHCVHGRIEFKDVTFAYPSRNDTPILKNVSFSVAPGEVVALVGPSGSGKTSCINLMEHFYETCTGSVLLDGHPIQSYDHTYLHTKVALVGQEPVLYARSLKDNIRCGLPEEHYGMERVIRAANLANAHHFIMEMKKEYDTQAGEKGLQLSGGQKQRIAIARALIRNPAILLLDEATSALDAESEHVVQQAIYKNLQGKTVIIIAHRLSTVEKADRIIVIEKGQVVEQGSHSELLSRKGLYTKLVKRQLKDTNSS